MKKKTTIKHAKIHGDYSSWSDSKLNKESIKLFNYFKETLPFRYTTWLNDLLEMERELTLRENQ